MTRQVEGLEWPEGDPDGLRAAGTHAATLAGELDSRRNVLLGVGPVSWLGAGRDNFAVALAEHGGALETGAAAMRQAATALRGLATTVEQAQHTVLMAARKLKTARDEATQARQQAIRLRQVADQQSLLDSPLTRVLPGPSPAEIAAGRAEIAASTAEAHAIDVEHWAQGQARQANADVRRADRTCADTLESLGLVTAPGVSTPSCVAVPPGRPMATLGNALLGSGASTDGSLMSVLSSPPPPPPPPPKPVEHHHSGWGMLAAAGLGVVTAGMTVVDAAQLGLDPVTDGATVGLAAETADVAGDALATDAAADTAATGETAVGGATVEEGAADVVAAEGDPGAGLPVKPGPPDPPVEDPPSGTQYVTTPRGTTYDVPRSWVPREADNGRGIVYQRPGATGNADSIRIMEPTPKYPDGYVRYYNDSGQPLSPAGKPGTQAETHIPETYRGPLQGWPK